MRIAEQMLLDAHPSDSGTIDSHARELQEVRAHYKVGA